MVEEMVAHSVQQHARFFDHLVELIPPRFYYSDGEERVDLRTMKKAARLAAKQDFKAKHKENKRAKLDPDAPATALAIQQQGEGSADGSGADGTQRHPQEQAQFKMNLGPSALSRDELKAKLQRKLEAIRQERGDKKADKQAVAAQAKEWRQKVLTGGAAQQKQQHHAATPAAAERRGQLKAAGQKRRATEGPDDRHEQQGRPSVKSAPAAASDAPSQAGQQQQGGSTGQEEDFQFARLQFEDGRLGGAKATKKKPTKEQLLAAAEAKQAERQAVAASQEGQVHLVHEGWRTALARAAGEKVLDDPKLLKKSLKKEAKRKEKSTKAWQERKSAQQEHMDKKQQRRTENLQARVDTKIVKKKEKREKKLLGAGFEGRRTTFLGNGGASAGAAKKA